MDVTRRTEIATGLDDGSSLTRIAKSIDQATSAISREIARNSTQTKGYRMAAADVAAERRRIRPQVKEDRPRPGPEDAGAGRPKRAHSRARSRAG
jgi:IS30 family transposase